MNNLRVRSSVKIAQNMAVRQSAGNSVPEIIRESAKIVAEATKTAAKMNLARGTLIVASELGFNDGAAIAIKGGNRLPWFPCYKL